MAIFLRPQHQQQQQKHNVSFEFLIKKKTPPKKQTKNVFHFFISNKPKKNFNHKML